MNHIDVATLTRLRNIFLSGDGSKADYWQSHADLENYDQTFAQRIAWKWRHVFLERRQRHWQPPE